MRKSILNQLVSYQQLHLLSHHKILKQFEKEETELIEELSYIDYSTMDFVVFCDSALPQHDPRQKHAGCIHRNKPMGLPVEGSQASDQQRDHACRFQS